jgi:hypothetical protein
VLPPSFIRCVVQLCISDANKTLLLQSPEPIKLITEALLLDPQHIRNHGALDQSEDIKGAIQRDAAECFMQLALFEPGREMLQKDAAVIDSLRTLKDKALTEEASRFAEGALMALLPEEAAASRAVDTDALHVMMSYQWDVQPTVERIVAELQGRGHAVWLDLLCMKGSIVDACAPKQPRLPRSVHLLTACLQQDERSHRGSGCYAVWRLREIQGERQLPHGGQLRAPARA